MHKKALHCMKVGQTSRASAEAAESLHRHAYTTALSTGLTAAVVPNTPSTFVIIIGTSCIQSVYVPTEYHEHHMQNWRTGPQTDI